MALGFFKSDPQTALMDPDVIAAKRKLLLAADAERRKIKPIQHWTQGAAMLANALADKSEETKLNEASTKGNSVVAALLASQFGTPAAASSPAAASVPGGAVTGTPGATSAVVNSPNPYAVPNDKMQGPFSTDLLPGAIQKMQARAVGGAATRPESFTKVNPEAAIRTAVMLENLPSEVGITSAHRNEASNKSVGGATHSNHLNGSGFDLSYKTPQGKQAILDAIKNQGMRTILGSKGKQYKTHVHADLGAFGGAYAGQEVNPTTLAYARTAPQAIAQATAANPASTPAAAPVAAPAATGGVNPALAKIISNPVAMKWVAKNPAALAMLMQQMKSNSPAARLALQNAQLGIDLKRQQIAELAKGKRQVVTRQDGSIITVDPSGRSPAQVLAPPDNARAPVTKNIKQPDGSEVAVQWEPKTQTWKPMVAPEGGKSFNPKLTEGQSKDQGFYVRGFDANKILTKNEKALTSYKDTGAAAIPGFGNSLVSNDYRRASRAARDVLSVILRKDTGAAVTPQEFSEYGKIFIPAPGDDDTTIKDKATARALAIDAIKRGLGNTGKIVEYATKGKFSVDANGNLIQGGAAAAVPGTPKTSAKSVLDEADAIVNGTR